MQIHPRQEPFQASSTNTRLHNGMKQLVLILFCSCGFGYTIERE